MYIALRSVITALLNLTFDGENWYEYDAWNRLLQINDAGTLEGSRENTWVHGRRMRSHLQQSLSQAARTPARC